MQEYGTVTTFIEVLNASGVEYVFFNPGIDNVPLLETISRYHATDKKAPRSILCLDEFVTMTAAHGNYMATGRPQAVSVHSELGTLQIGGALHNAQWGKVPVVFFTESLGPAQRTDWQGNAFDQGRMVRNLVKWDHQVTEGEDIGEAFSEAFRIATTEPCGPVYLTLPRDVLWRRGNASSGASPVTAPITPPPKKAAPEDLDAAAAMLLAAENPLIITGHSGRNRKSVTSLTVLAESLGARVQSADTRMNFPNTHPLAACDHPNPESGIPLLSTADAILAIDYDMHYAAPPVFPKSDARIIHIDIDIAKNGVPLWERQPDISIEGDSSSLIPALTDAVQKLLTSEKRRSILGRCAKIKAEHVAIRKEWKSLAESHSAKKPVSAHWLCRCINEVVTDDTIIVNQTVSPSMIVANMVRRNRPGTLVSCAGGCIGWAPGAALGVKLASPDSTVVSLMGDGAFIYGCPESTLWSAGFYHAPFLSIIFNNRGYGAVKELFHERYDVENMGADIPASPNYAMIAQSCNAYGQTVKEPADLLPALDEALAQLKKGRPAVLDVRIEPV